MGGFLLFHPVFFPSFCRRPGAPLGALMHLAGVLADGVLPSLTLESLERSYAPKVDLGAKADGFDGKFMGKSLINGGFHGIMCR